MNHDAVSRFTKLPELVHADPSRLVFESHRREDPERQGSCLPPSIWKVLGAGSSLRRCGFERNDLVSPIRARHRLPGLRRHCFARDRKSVY